MTTSSEREHRLVGIGKCTKGVKYTFRSGKPVVIGRHASCTLVINKTPEKAGDFEYLSRLHAVVEQDSDNAWRIRDNGSSNGTAILRRGLPPAVKLSPGVGEVLRD